MRSNGQKGSRNWGKGEGEKVGMGKREEEKEEEGGNGKRPPVQTPLKQKHPFSSENKPPSQDLREWATSAGRGSSNEGQDVPLRTHLSGAVGQKPQYIEPLSPSVTVQLRPPSRAERPNTEPGSPLPARLPLTELMPARRRRRAWSCAQHTKTERH